MAITGSVCVQCWTSPAQHTSPGHHEP